VKPYAAKEYLKKTYTSRCEWVKARGLCNNGYYKTKCKKTCNNSGTDAWTSAFGPTNVYEKKTYTHMCAYYKENGNCQTSTWVRNTACKKTCTGGGADKASYNKSPYTRWVPKVKSFKQYPTYCDYMKARMQCAHSSALLYCAKTCDGCRFKKCQANIPRYMVPYAKKTYKKKTYSSRCAWAKAMNYCTRSSWYRDRKCAKTCKGSGADDAAYSKAFTTTERKTVSFPSLCAYYKSKGLCAHNHHIKKSTCPKTCGYPGASKDSAQGSRAYKAAVPVVVSQTNYKNYCEYRKSISGSCPSWLKRSCRMTCKAC
jgi:hypothetical protein